MKDMPVLFTISYVSETAVRVYTKDTRWKEEDLTMDFDDVPPSHLYSCIDAITSVGNSKGYAILFEVN